MENKLKKTAASLLLGAGLLLATQAQAQSDTVRISCQAFLTNYGLNASELSDTAAFRQRLENLDTPYPQSAELCRDYSAKLATASADLAKSGTVVDGVLWIDSLSCYSDYGHYSACLDACQQVAQAQQERYTRLEQERLAEEKRIAEEKARVEAKRIQDELDAQWAELLGRVNSQHEQILSLCDGNGISDKTKLKGLSELSFDYRNCYGRFNLSATQGDEHTIARVEKLDELQRTLIDSVLGPDSYTARIEGFSNSLKARAGKQHHDVFKSYNRVFKNVKVPTHFGQYEEFDAFVSRLRDITEVQQGYMAVIELREEISNNTTALRNQSGKKYKALFESYSKVVDAFNQVPAFATVGERNMFIATLEEFTRVQYSYQVSIQRIELIQHRTDSIIALCVKPYADAATSYRELVAGTNFVPNFNSERGAEFFMKVLDDFETLQRDYIEAIGLRQTIASQDVAVLKSKKAPKELITYYKDLKTRTSLVATFNNHEKAEQYLELLQNYANTQSRILESEQLNLQLVNNAQTIKTQSKSYGNILKAYNFLYSGADWPKAIRVENDLTRYIDTQREIVEMQEQVIITLAGPDAADKNTRLKALLKEKNKNNIRIVLGIQTQ